MDLQHAEPATRVRGWGRIASRADEARRQAATNQVAGAWTDRYAHRLVATDVGAIVVALAAALAIHLATGGRDLVSGEFQPDYVAVTMVIGAAWITALSLWKTRDRRRIGVGNAEFVRVFHATWKLFAAIAIIAYLLRMELGRTYLGVALALGLALLLLNRLAWRRWLHARRRKGEYSSPTLIIGHRDKAAGLIDLFHSNPDAGYTVVGVCVPTGDVGTDETVGGVPILGSMENAARVAVQVGASAVAVSGSDTITSETVRRLGWDLEGKGIDLALTLTLLDVAGPRVHMQPVNGLPLMYVDEPRFSGRKYIAKTVFDVVSAAVLVTLLSPLLLAIGIAVKVTSPGPVFYQQERVGRNGRTFKMLKFRSMVTNAHERLAEVLESEGVSGVGMFYKPKNDPRVTKVGKFIRRYSLDELPQLFNVLRGDMSLVGPRPQIWAEVAQYDRTAHRRLLVKPGLTGLWQVSGRNSLGLTESIRMDVSYVENWTLFGDITILARTFRAMIGGEGAY